jgi:hypothetical protein
MLVIHRRLVSHGGVAERCRGESPRVERHIVEAWAIGMNGSFRSVQGWFRGEALCCADLEPWMV